MTNSRQVTVRSHLSLALALAGAALVCAPAHADPLHGGSWSGHLMDGSLKLGDGLLPAGNVAAGGPGEFSVPPDSAPVGFRLGGTQVNFANFVREAATGTGDEYTASGVLYLSAIDAQVDPGTGAVSGNLSATGTIDVSGRTLFQGQQTGTFSGTCEVREAATPAPVPLAPTSGNSGGAPWSLASGTFTISDPGGAIPVSCANVPAAVRDELLGSTDAGHNALSLGGVFSPVGSQSTVVPGPPDIVAVDPTNPVVAGPARRPCVVPQVRGRSLDAAKKTIKRAGCAVGTITRKRSSRFASGVVLKQSARAGTTRAPGYHLRLRVAK